MARSESLSDLLDVIEKYTSGKKTNYYFFSKEHKNLMVYTSILKNNKEISAQYKRVSGKYDKY